MFPVPPFFPESLSQRAAKIGSELVTKNQLAEASDEKQSFPEDFGVLHGRSMEMGQSSTRAGAGGGRKEEGVRLRNREHGSPPFLKHGSWQKCLVSLSFSVRAEKSLTHRLTAEGKGFGKALKKKVLFFSFNRQMDH